MALAHRKTVSQARKPARKVRLRVVSNRYGGMLRERVERYSDILLRAIRRELGGTVFFTREDLIHLSVFNHVSTMYRYDMVCVFVSYLSERGDIVKHNRTDLSLKDRASHFDPTPLRDRYDDTIRKIITGSFKLRERFTVMDIVDEWKTDSNLTINNKRVAVRSLVPRLLKDGSLGQADDFNYVRKG